MQNAMYFNGEAFLKARGERGDAIDAADHDRAQASVSRSAAAPMRTA